MATLRNLNCDITVMSNRHLFDTTISLKAKGLLSQMLSLPQEWDYTIAGLVAINRENETAIVSALHELKNAGYLKVIKRMPNETASGRVEYDYDVYEMPQIPEGEKQEGKKQDLENLPLEFLPLENPPLAYNNNINNKNEPVKKNIGDNEKKGEEEKNIGDNEKKGEEEKNIGEENKEDKILKKEKEKEKEKNRFAKFTIPTLDEVRAYCAERGNKVDADRWYNHYESVGWKVGRNPMRDWKAAVRTWETNGYGSNQTQRRTVPVLHDLDDLF